MTIIDLGEVAHDRPAPTLPVNVRPVVRAVLAAVTLAGTLALTGAARPAPPTVRPLWGLRLADQDSGSLNGDAVYLTREVDGRSVVTAHDAATGKTRWTAPLGKPTATPHPPSFAAGLVLIPLDPVGMGWSDDTASYWTSYSRGTLALDAATGAERWRTTGEIGPLERDPRTGLAAEYAGRGLLTHLRLIRLADGHQLWDRPVLNATTWTIIWDGDQARSIAYAVGGEITVLRYADGTLQHRGRPPGSGAVTEVLGAGTDLAIRRRTAPFTVVRPGDLSAVWHTDAGVSYLDDCGAVLCALDDSGIAGRDRATGREIWRQPDMTGFFPVGPGRVMVADGSPGGILRLVDTVSGRPLGGVLYGAMAAGAPTGSVLITRRATGQPGRQVVLRVDPVTGAQTPLGTMPSTGDLPCALGGRYLACSHEGQFSVTAVG